MSGGAEVQLTDRRAIVLVNTHSRRGKDAYEEVIQRLSDLGLKLEKTVACEKPEAMLKEAKAAVKGGIPLLIAGGGDGTFNSLAETLIGSKTTLGVLPLGTGNAFARDLDIPFDLELACRVLVEGKVSEVDVGEANGRPFVNVATVGLTTRIAQELQESVKRRFGKFVYVYAVIKALQKIRPFHAVLETENGTTSFETLEVVIGNGKYHAGPFRIAPDAGIETGKLSVYALEGATKAALFRLAIHLPTATHVALSEVHSESASAGTLTTTPIVKATLDGEVGPRTPLKFRVRPGALKVVTPQKFRGA